jgi:hypothetical protein
LLDVVNPRLKSKQKIGSRRWRIQGCGERLLAQKQAKGDAAGHCRQQDEGKANGAEKSDVGGFILGGL